MIFISEILITSADTNFEVDSSIGFDSDLLIARNGKMGYFLFDGGGKNGGIISESNFINETIYLNFNCIDRLTEPWLIRDLTILFKSWYRYPLFIILDLALTKREIFLIILYLVLTERENVFDLWQLFMWIRGFLIFCLLFLSNYHKFSHSILFEVAIQHIDFFMTPRVRERVSWYNFSKDHIIRDAYLLQDQLWI